MSEAKYEAKPRGLARDIHRAREGATATAGELREFVKQLKGRSPQEMLGIVAGSGLVRSTVLATVITVVFMVGFTVGPYLYGKANPKQPVADAEAAKPAAPAAPTAAAAPAAAAAAPAGPAVAGTVLSASPGAGRAPTDPTMTDPLKAANEVKSFDPLNDTKDDDFFNTKRLK